MGSSLTASLGSGCYNISHSGACSRKLDLNHAVMLGVKEPPAVSTSECCPEAVQKICVVAIRFGSYEPWSELLLYSLADPQEELHIFPI